MITLFDTLKARPLILSKAKDVQRHFNEQVPLSMIMTKDVNGNVTYSSGVHRDIIDELFRRLHWTYVYHFIRIN